MYKNNRFIKPTIARHLHLARRRRREIFRDRILEKYGKDERYTPITEGNYDTT